MEAFFDFYMRSLPLMRERTRTYWGHAGDSWAPAQPLPAAACCWLPAAPLRIIDYPPVISPVISPGRRVCDGVSAAWYGG
eukprot:COSAG01_NODE_468_length_16589_cov_4.457429_4_plen_80_part_00